ncbi:MAG: GNAT family N-acetyltransferase [Bacteroidetes bacterium]|nr:GNAT family N-acetyltransferase [Bacteroidota bacterium]
MTFRPAIIQDIPQIQIVRNSVKENTLSNPNLIKDADIEHFMTKRGKGWVCEVENQIVGFSIVDLEENNVWALFIKPAFEKKGIGRKLHDLMINWYFKQTTETIWLGTSLNTRSEIFYEKCGWDKVGMYGEGEVKFEMGFNNWQKTENHDQ